MNLLFPTKNIELNLGETITFNQVTGKLDASRIEGDLPAEQSSYDNTESGLEATNVQDAIDEVNTKINNIPSVDAYTKEEANDKFATKTALQTVAEAIPTKTSELTNDSGFAEIDDASASASKTYSSNKIDSEFSSVKNDFETEDDVINHNITSMLYSGNLNDGNVGYKRGRVNLSTGEYMDATTKKALVDKNYEPIELKSNSIVLHIATGYKTRGVILNPDKSYNNYIPNFSTGGAVAELQNKKGYFVMLYIEKTDGTDISDNELTTANEQTLYLEAVLGLDSGILGEFDKKANLKDFKTETEVINQNILSMLYNGNLNDGNIGYKKGSVNLLTGEYISPNAKKSIVDKDFEPIELKSNTIVIHIGSAYKTRGVILNPDKSYNSYFAGWSTGGTVDALQNKKGYYVMLVVERIDGADITDQEREAANEKTMYIEAVLGLENGVVGEIIKGNKLFTGKKIVNFGDSLFGNFRDDNTTTHKSISKMLSENLGATVYNAGFGGCRMSERLYGATFWNAFAMYSLADSVYSEDWSVQDQALIDGAGTIPDYFADTVAMLKTIDFSEVDIITISYGTNDYTGETPLTGSGVEYQNYEGALRYSLRKLLSKYPSMRIVVLSPAWRFWYSGGAYSYSSDDEQSRNNNGDLLTDFVASCDDVCKEYHIPYVDMYYNLGFNPYSYQAYFSDIDSTHPIQLGRQLMADRISGQLIALLHH